MIIQKPVKFRIWDHEQEEMWTSVLKDMGEHDMYDEEESMWSIAYMMENGESDRFVVMQFANIQDVNEQDIFEGDVLRNLKTNEVFLVKDMRMFFGHPCDGKTDSMLEIIGNIYEQPDVVSLLT